jgi:hypothetical protein
MADSQSDPPADSEPRSGDPTPLPGANLPLRLGTGARWKDVKDKLEGDDKRR